MDHGKKKMMHGGKHDPRIQAAREEALGDKPIKFIKPKGRMKLKKVKVKKMMKGGKMMPKMLGGGLLMKKDKPMFMAGGKVFKDGGKLMEALLKNPEQRARAKRILGMK